MTEPRAEVRWSAVIGAALGGLVLEWLVIAFAIVILLSIGSDDSVGTAFLVVAFVALPAATALTLFFRRSRLVGASALIGLLIGSIVGAGVCAGFLQSG